MKNEKTQNEIDVVKRNRGFTLIEIMITLVIVAGVLFLAAPKIVAALNSSKANTIQDQISQIVRAAETYRMRFNNYSGMDITELYDESLLTYVKDASGSNVQMTNPYGGSYVANPGADTTQLVVSTSNIKDAGICRQVAAYYQRTALSATCSGSTVSVTFQG